MPTEVPPEQRRLSAAISATRKHEPFSGQVPNLTQKETEFWKSGSTAGTVDGVKKMITSISKPTAKLLPGSEEKLESHQSHLRQQNGVLGLQHLMGSEKKSAFSVSPWRFTDYDFGFLSNIHQPLRPSNANGNRADLGVLNENSLFSNSLPETFGQKVTLSSRDVSFHQPTHQVHSSVNEDEPLESLKEIEARTIGDLLPDDDDLFSGVDDVGCIPQSNNLDDAEDDIFGMELEIDDMRGSNRTSRHPTMVCRGAPTGLNSSYSGEHPLGELPSRTLFVRNINSSVEDEELKSLFEKHGDIRMLYTVCKHRGFVMISYYDIRSAINAMKLLQNKPLRRRKLDIHFSIPKDNLSEKDINHGTISVSNLDSSVSNDDIHRIFRVYGEIKEIREAPHKHCQKTVEFYDSRNAEDAIHALDGSLISGRKIKLDPSSPQFTMRGLMQPFPSYLEKEEDNKWQKGSPPNGSTVRPGLASNGVNNVALQGQYISQETVTPVCDASPHRSSSCFPPFISSRNPSVGNPDDQSGAAGIEGSLEKTNLSFQRMPSIHSHSLPECQNSLATGVLTNSPAVMPAMDARIGRHLEGIDGRHIKGGLSYNHTGAFGAPGNASCPLHGHQYSRDKFHSHHPSHMGNFMWQNSPPFVNNLSTRSPSPMHGFQRTSSHMANMVPFHHHGGSAPSTNAPLWDRHHAYSGDLVDSPHFHHPASLGNMGFSASPTLHPMELASHNIFPFPEGNCMDASLAAPHIGIPSQQSCQMFAGQNPMIHLNGRYDAHSDRMRNRKSDSTANQGDKKQYELDIERIIHGEDNRTTLMIKNIPNKYTSKMLLATIDEHHRGTYDFIYLPIDFKNKCNVGYAFINLTDPKHIISFYEAFNGKKWEKFNSEKVASLAYARIQGKTALVAHFQNSSLMNEDKRCRPILFHSEGPNAGDQEPFPMGPSIRSRSGRSRSNNSSDDDNQDTPPKSSREEETPVGLNASIGELSIAC